jgi:hypothetical protein
MKDRMIVKNKLHIIIMVFSSIFILITSCTYTRPPISFRTSYENGKDSITNCIVKEKTYSYLSIRRLAIVGGYYKHIEFDSLENKVKIIQSKKTPLHMFDGHVRSYRKVKYFDLNGIVIQVDKRIFQSQGRGGRTVVDKSTFYKNGKKINQKNNKD